jgi:methylenetetrahydrofolate reductase (NADPH)
MNDVTNLQAVLGSGAFAVTAECGPPRGADSEAVRRKGNLLKGYVDSVNVTDNQTAVVRMSSLAASLILKEMGIEPVMQVTCRDRNRIALQSDILGAGALGIGNILCLSGDHQKFGDHPQARNVFDIDSIQLIRCASRLSGEGRLINGREVTVSPRLYVGCVENPFADPFEIRALRLAKKAAAGARFVQTQCVFNVARFEKWMAMVRDLGLDKKIAILAGITPMKSVGMARYMQHSVPGMEVPEEILRRLSGVPPKEAPEEGLRMALETIEQVRGIKGVSGVHIMAIEGEAMVARIVEGAGLFPRPGDSPKAGR